LPPDLSYIPKEKLERAPMQSALSFASTKEADLSNHTRLGSWHTDKVVVLQDIVWAKAMMTRPGG
jgi:hypothetical protein